jgi:CubicO group peptidase (beta-lactamase class C family)
VGALADGGARAPRGPAGIDQALAARLVGGVLDGTYADVDAVLVYQGGRLVLEEYFHGYHAGRPHQMRSASKSVVSALVGLAVGEGKLAGESERVVPRLSYGPLPAYANPDPRKAALTLADLLTMRSGLACDDWDDASPGNENRMYGTADWVKFTLDLPQLHDPGAVARYCTGGIHVAGRVVERAVGTPLPAFAQRALFGPLGIRPEAYRWPYTLDSTNAATVAQLYLRPRDLLKLGVLYLDGGRWQGRQVVASAWVARSTARVTQINTRGYGYAWWHQPFTVPAPGGTRRVEVLNASGNGGQKLYILPEQGTVVVFTGSDYNNPRETAPNAIMAELLLPALLAPAARPPR